MQHTGSVWNSLEIAKLVVGMLTPFVVVAFGWHINRRLKRLDFVQWNSQKVIEKRLVIYDQIAPKLNALFCFFTWAGYWKDVSPHLAVSCKRDLDKDINIYRHLFEDDVYRNYQAFIHLLFETYNGPGKDARLRSVIRGPEGDRTVHCSYKWIDEWDQLFGDPGDLASNVEIRRTYNNLMASLTKSLGVRQ